MTPTPTPRGEYGDPILAECEGSYSGSTSLHPSNFDNYAGCATGMVGPEVVYALDCSERLLLLNLNFGAAADLRLFLIAGDGSRNCLGVVDLGGALVVPNVDAARYFLVVDGTMAGTYFFSVHCQSAEPTRTPTPTLIPTATRTATATRPPLDRQVFLPMVMKSRSWAHSAGRELFEDALQWAR